MELDPTLEMAFVKTSETASQAVVGKRKASLLDHAMPMRPADALAGGVHHVKQDREIDRRLLVWDLARRIHCLKRGREIEGSLFAWHLARHVHYVKQGREIARSLFARALARRLHHV